LSASSNDAGAKGQIHDRRSDSGQLFEFNQKRTGADELSYQRTLTGSKGRDSLVRALFQP